MGTGGRVDFNALYKLPYIGQGLSLQKKSLEKVDQVTAGKATYNTDAPPPCYNLQV